MLSWFLVCSGGSTIRISHLPVLHNLSQTSTGLLLCPRSYLYWIFCHDVSAIGLTSSFLWSGPWQLYSSILSIILFSSLVFTDWDPSSDSRFQRVNPSQNSSLDPGQNHDFISVAFVCGFSDLTYFVPALGLAQPSSKSSIISPL